MRLEMCVVLKRRRGERDASESLQMENGKEEEKEEGNYSPLGTLAYSYVPPDSDGLCFRLEDRGQNNRIIY